MKKSIKFIITSGCGFVIDFIVYITLTTLLNVNVDIANIASSLLGTSFVFFVSTKKIFETNINRISLKSKYIIYIIYQCVFIFITSKILLFFKELLLNSSIELITKYSSLIVKVCITPLTLTINYFVMKKLTKL